MLSSQELTGVVASFSVGELVAFFDIEKEVVFCRIYEEYEEPTTKTKGFTFEILHPYSVKNPITGELTPIKTGSLPSFAFKKVNEA